MNSPVFVVSISVPIMDMPPSNTLVNMTESELSHRNDDSQSQILYSATTRWLQETSREEYWNAVARLSDDVSKERRQRCKL